MGRRKFLEKKFFPERCGSICFAKIFAHFVRRQARRFALLAHENAVLHRGVMFFSHVDADLHRESVRVRNTRMNPFMACETMVVTFLLLQRRMESNKGRSCRPVEKEPVGGAGRRSVCNSLRGSNEKKSDRAACRRNSTNCGTRQPAPPPAVLREPHRLFF